MCSQAQPLHLIFFPHMEAGHMIPMVDMAKLFAARGVKATIVTTPANADLIRPAIDNHPIDLVTIPFPSDASLPEGCENLSSLPSTELQLSFHTAVSMLRQPFDELLADLRPDCVVGDVFLPWTYDVAARYGIPRIAFFGTGFFPLCAILAPLPDNESFIIEGLPHRIEMLRSQVPDFIKPESPLSAAFIQMEDSIEKSYGVVVNSFYGLEPDYVEHYRNVIDRKAWHVGPVSLCNKHELDMHRRGKNSSSSDETETYLKWLDQKTPSSVVYVCFGSLNEFTDAQLREIALGLEVSGYDFIWVVKKSNEGSWMSAIGDRGMVIKGWAPQMLILSHGAVGGFVTHCGWNSTMEGVSVGVPMVTWPLSGEQFYNERLIVDVLGIGTSVGGKKANVRRAEDRAVVGAAEVAEAVRRVMGGEGEGMRERVRELREKARRAVEEGGSSDLDMGSLIAELLSRRGPGIER